MTATLPSNQGEKCQNTHRIPSNEGTRLRKALHQLELAECCIKCAIADLDKPARSRMSLVLGHIAMDMDILRAGSSQVDDGGRCE